MTQKSIISVPGLFLTILLLSGCSNKENLLITEIPTKNGKISKIDFNLIPSEIREIKLSDIVTDFQVIPLETKTECLISNTQIEFSNDCIFVGTQNFPGAARLYRFDKNGSFINEIGKSGQGPGEHIGYSAEVIRSYPDNSTVLISWGGSSGEKPQLFNNNGTLIKEIVQPFYLRYIEKWSDSIWFSPGAFAGKVTAISDSFAIVFYTSDGKILNKIPRKSFPAKNLNGYTPSPWEPSVYKFNNQWRLYFQGNDTVFRIVDFKLNPIAVLNPDQKALKYNQPMSSEELSGKYSLSILSETNNNWFIDKSIIIKAELHEYSSGQWGGGFTNEHQLIIIDKKSNQAINGRIVDDIFNIFPNEIFTQILKWQDNKFYFAVPPIFLNKLFKELKEENITNPDVKAIIEKLKTIPEDSNPVIFSFSINDRVKLSDK